MLYRIQRLVRFEVWIELEGLLKKYADPSLPVWS
jgi:hypothetical protein